MVRKSQTPEEVSIAVLSEQIKYLVRNSDDLKQGIKNLDQKVDSNFVTKIEFAPIRNIVYALVGLTLTAVMAAILALIIKQ